MSLLINNTTRKPGTTKGALYLPEEMIRALHAFKIIWKEDINKYVEDSINFMFEFNPSAIIIHDMNNSFYGAEEIILPIEVMLPIILALNLFILAEKTNQDISDIMYDALYFHLHSYMPNACAYDSEPNPEPPEPPGHYEWFEEHWL